MGYKKSKEQEMVHFLYGHEIYAQRLTEKTIGKNGVSPVAIIALIVMFATYIAIIVGTLILFITKGENISIVITVISIEVILGIFIPVTYLSFIAQIITNSRNPKVAKEWLERKIRKLWFLNHKVVTVRDWRRIKKNSQKKYQDFREGLGNKDSIEICKWICMLSRDKKITVKWLLYIDNNYHWTGIGILQKGNYIYDPIRRKTYNANRYYSFMNMKRVQECGAFRYGTFNGIKNMSLEEKIFRKRCQVIL